MKNIKILIFIVLALLTFSSCRSSSVPHSSTQQPSTDFSVEPTAEITLEEVSSRAAGYYPEQVSFKFVGQDKITDESSQGGFAEQECYLFDVTYEGKKVSGVAVGIEDASVWILDMNADNLWLSEGFMGLPQSAQPETTKRDPVIELAGMGENGDEPFFYFARLDTIPEFSNQNEGSIRWKEAEKTLTIGAVKATGSVTGAIDGPSVKAVISWKNGEPEIVSVEYEPAPTFSHPSQVLLSGEVMNIEADRLIEIGEYFKDLVQEKLIG